MRNVPPFLCKTKLLQIRKADHDPEADEEPGLFYQTQGRKTDRRLRMEDAPESRMPVLKLTEECQTAKITKGDGTGETFSKESELKML